MPVVAPWRKAILALAVLPVFLFPSVGVLYFGTDSMGGQMGNCPFGGHSMVICEMNPMEHIQEWQSMFTMLPAQNILLLLFALIAFFIIWRLRSWKFFVPEPLFLLSSNSRLAYVQSFQIPDPLKEAFSSGILNPKIF